MTFSRDTDKLFPAMAACYQNIRSVAADAVNEADDFRYATLDAIGGAIKRATREHGLLVIQAPELSATADDPKFVMVHARVIHAASGQWYEPPYLEMPIASPRDARAIGEAITYARKYQLASAFGVTVGQADIDGQGTTFPGRELTVAVDTYRELTAAIIKETIRVGGVGVAREAIPNLDAMSFAQRLVALRALPDAPEMGTGL